MKKVSAGNAGPKVRSDCQIILEPAQRGGIAFDLKSKVKSLYGESIKDLCRQMLHFYGIKNAKVDINDSGALPFVIMARLEAAVRSMTGTESEYLPEMLKENLYKTSAGRTRFSRLYLPGNNPGLMINAGLHQAHGIILDLEDSVAPDRKEEARILVRNALRQIDFRGAERMVRINQGETGFSDLESVIPQNVNLILIPKCETAENVREVEGRITSILKRNKIRNEVFLMPIVESARGVANCYEIAMASESVVAIAVGLEDLTADLGIQRTPEGTETLFARSQIVIAAKAAGIQPIDSVYSDVADIEGLTQNVIKSKNLGFEGMGCIHPRQIRVINNGYAPTEQDIEKARKIVAAYEEAVKNGTGVVAVGSKMIDAPVVKRALKTIELARKMVPGKQ